MCICLLGLSNLCSTPWWGTKPRHWRICCTFDTWTSHTKRIHILLPTVISNYTCTTKVDHHLMKFTIYQLCWSSLFVCLFVPTLQVLVFVDSFSVFWLASRWARLDVINVWWWFVIVCYVKSKNETFYDINHVNLSIDE